MHTPIRLQIRPHEGSRRSRDFAAMTSCPRLAAGLLALFLTLFLGRAMAQGTVQTAKPFGGCDSTMGPFCNMSAASDKYVCQVADGSLLVFSKSGQLIQNKAVSSFIGVAANGFYLNPVIEFDQVSKRWLLSGGVNPGGFAVSYSDDPTGPWNGFSFPFPGANDGGRCGYNASAYFYYMTGSSNGWVVIDKASVLANTGTCTWHYVTNPSGNTMTQMADDTTVGNPDDPYWVYDSTHLYKVTNYLSGAANGTVVTPTVVTYPLTGGTFSSKYAIIQNGKMAGVKDFPMQNPLQWSEVDLATATVTQSGSIPIPQGLQLAEHAYCGNSPNGDIGICFWATTVDFSQPNYTSSLGVPVNYYAVAPQMKFFVTGRAASDPPGTMRPCVEVTHGAAITNRPGDYASVTYDPADGTLWACNDTGDANTFSANVNFTISGTLATVLPPVMGLGALSNDGTNVNVQWNAVAGASGYQLMRTSDKITYTVVATLPGTQTTYTDQPGTPVTNYYYNVLAINGPTTSAAPQSVQTLKAPTAPTYNSLSAPTGLTAGLSATGSGVQLSWNDVAGENGFAIERAGNGTTWTRITTTANGIRTYTDASPAGSNLYYYRVEALNSSGTISPPSSVVTITNRPSPPSNVIINGTWPNQVEVRWLGSSSAQFNVPSATGFTIYRSSDGTNFSPVGTSPANFDCYVDATGLTPGVQYWYRVVTNGVVGDSLPSSTVTATPVIWTPANLTSTQGTNQTSFQWLAVPGALSYQVRRSTDGTNFSVIATTSSASYTDTTGVANQLYYYNIVAVGSGSGNVSVPSTTCCSIVPPPPSPWQSVDIGLTNSQGCAGYNSSSGLFTVGGIGSDIWGTSDQFHYVYQPFNGNGAIIARVASEANTNAWAKAGVMIRNSTNPKDQYAFMLLAPSGTGVDFHYRTASGASAASIGNTTGPTAPYWVKVVCSGNTYTGYYSTNGTTWIQKGSVTMTMGANPLIGLAVCSHDTGKVNATTFDHVSLFSVPQNYSMLADSGSSAPINMLSGVTVPSGGTASVTAVTQGSLGSVVNSGGGIVTYTSNAGSTGQDTFTCTISDGLGDSVNATVTVHIGQVWTNASGGSWATSANWQGGVVPSGSGATADFSTLNLAANATVTLDGTRTVGMLAFGSQSGGYGWTLNSGSGGNLVLASSGTQSPVIQVNNGTATINTVISGTQGLTSTGSGTLILKGANTYSGTTTVSGGTLEADAKSTTDTAYTVAQGATLKYGYNTATSYNGNPAITINGNGASDPSGLYILGGKTLTFGAGALDLKGAPTTIRAFGTGIGNLQPALYSAPLYAEASASGSVIDASVNIVFNNYIYGGLNIQTDAGANTATGDLTINGALTGSFSNSSQSNALNKTGTGSLKLTGSNTFNLSGSTAVNVQNGVLILSGGNNRLPVATQITLGSGTASGTLILGDSSGPVTQTVTNLVAGGGITGDAVVGGASTNSTLTVNATAGGGITYSGALGGAGPNANNLALTKTGTGALTLAGVNTYTGATVITSGTLLVNGSLANTPTTVAAAGTLSGTGNIAGSVTNNGTLAPGANGIGTLTINGTLTLGGTTAFELNKTGTALTNDLVQGLAGVIYGGTLNVTCTGDALAAGDTFKLFDATSYSGSFGAVNMPALGTGLTWDVSQLGVGGTVTVVPVAYTLAYSAGANGTLGGTTSQTVNYGTSGTAITATANTGYHFVNWSDGSTVNPRTDTNVTGNLTVTASFAINTYTLAYSAGANGTLGGTTAQTVNYGASGTAITATANTGYHFVNWSDGSTVNPRTDTNVTGNITVTAGFAINTYTLAYSAGANGSLSGTTPQTVNYGASGTAVSATANTGYHFVNWSDGSTVNPRADTNVTGNVSVTASFAINTYTLTYSAGANGTLSGTTMQTVNYGASGTAVSATASTGYHFVSWSDGSTANPRTDANVTSNITVTASFADTPPTFIANPITGAGAMEGIAYTGSIASYGNDVDAGDALTYSKVSGPTWLTVAGDGTLSGTPANSDGGLNSFAVQVTDTAGASATATVNITVVANNNGVFTSLTGGSWTTTGNWSGGVLANGIGKTADFSTLNLTADATVTLDGFRTIGNLTFGDTTASNNWTLNTGTGGTLTLDVTSGTPAIAVNNQTATLNVVLAGTKGLAKTGAGNLALGGANTYSGGTTITPAGDTTAITVANASALGSDAVALNGVNTFSAGLAVNTGLTLANALTLKPTTNRAILGLAGTANWSGAITVDGSASGGLAVVLAGSTSPASPSILGANVSHTGTNSNLFVLRQTGGYGNVTGSISYGTGTVQFLDATNWQFSNVSNTWGTLDINNAGAVAYVGATNSLSPTGVVSSTVGGTLRLSNLASTSSYSQSIAGLGGSVKVAIATGSATLTLNTTSNQSSSGVISGAVSLVKSGTAVQTLSGVNTYTGTTTVSGGTLNVTGSLAAGAVTVQSGGTLAGSGSVNGATTVQSGGILAPGDAGPGTFSAKGNLTLSAGSVLNLELGTSSDKIAFTGTTFTGPSSGTVVINVLAAAGFTSGTYPVITGATGIITTGFSIGSVPLGYNVALNASSGTLSLVVTNAPPAPAPAMGNTGTVADLRDSDGDGISNRIEYATGTRPDVPNSGSPVALGKSSDGTKLTLTFHRIADTSLVYTVQGSDNLVDWQTVWSSTGAANTDGDVTVADGVTMLGHPTRFLRLVVGP